MNKAKNNPIEILLYHEFTFNLFKITRKVRRKGETAKTSQIEVDDPVYREKLDKGDFN